MKILYSQIKELLPQLKADPKEVANIFTLTGSMAEGAVEEVRWRNQKDYLISLEIRQNRPDCFSVIGLAKEIGAYYGLKLKLPKITLPPIKTKERLTIGLNAPDGIKRIMAVRIEGIKNGPSPEWLKDFLAFYDINSISLAVDLSNYVMLFTGYPSHLFDLSKVNQGISWSFNKDFNKIVTLDNSEINLKKKGDELIINDREEILALAGIVGGRAAEITPETESAILEMAVYEAGIIRKNSRDLKINTEASQRLSKNISPAGIDYAMEFLLSLLEKNCQAKITSQIFQYYPAKKKLKEIVLSPESPSLYAGIKISQQDSIRILKNLGFKIRISGKKIFCLAPLERTDISLEEDLVEEIIRMVGYNKIPAEELAKIEITQDITPKNIILAEKIRDILSSAEGLDEIFSGPLVREGDNEKINYFDWQIASTQNSVNEEYPDLRQSLAIGLVNQLHEYSKKNLDHIGIFEIGKIFGKKGKGRYQEKEVVGLLKQFSPKKKGLSEIKKAVENLLRLLGLTDISYSEPTIKPSIANPYSCWKIASKEKFVGIIYKIKKENSQENVYFAELCLDEMIKILEKTHHQPAVELTHKLVTLDANIELNHLSSSSPSIDEFLVKIKNKIGQKNIWSLAVVDEFPLDKKKTTRYTIRVSYVNLSDSEAKEIHMKSFNLR